MIGINPHPASFRDPAGFVFTANGILYRQVNRSYARQYETLMNSGLYDHLTNKALLLPHTQLPDNLIASPDHHLTLLPKQLPHITYASEWCPEQLKDAALLTLRIQQLAMDHGMTLKDATPFNVQFENGRAIFIDTLSFDLYDPAKPWIAYRQFCECFLFPLYLHRYAETGTASIAAAWPEGIPASLTARLLPLKSRWNSGAWLHVFLQARISSRQPGPAEQSLRFSNTKLTRLIEHLQSIITRLDTSPKNSSVWSNYYTETILGETYLAAKVQLFRQYLEKIRFKDALDLGCNDGRFSKILAETGVSITAIDSDWSCVNKLYGEHPANILPLCIDLANPTPASGFQNAEHASFTDRATSDLVAALALVHHLALRNNISLPLIADYFSRLTTKYLLIEFIPLSDEKAKELTARKETPTVGYDPEHFESAFSRHFRIDRKDQIPTTDRLLYLLQKS
jgi:SAM-dependent methyltransferase